MASYLSPLSVPSAPSHLLSIVVVVVMVVTVVVVVVVVKSGGLGRRVCRVLLVANECCFCFLVSVMNQITCGDVRK
ncbi:hypothetical protein E2C01_095726 [Portunus trituberculatus]|uniref:Transmembrane protein n=1 Tax=Portunus trituberculatus TaxID=210409 RepID=A0A5B7K052_PORTR|nr:hypothetical protein [Portunus trituberculatus]